MKNSCKCKCGVSKLAWILVIIGGLNWGLVGLGMLFGSGSWNVVNILLGSMPTVEAIIYLVVGIATVMTLMGCKCKKCKEGCSECKVSGDKPMSSAQANNPSM